MANSNIRSLSSQGHYRQLGGPRLTEGREGGSVLRGAGQGQTRQKSLPERTGKNRSEARSLLSSSREGCFSGTEDTLGCEKTSFGRGGYGRSSSGGGSGGGFRSFKPKPVEVGKEYDVTISEISRRGDGIAKVDGFVIFVAGAKQGWQGKIKVTQVANRFATGQILGGSEGSGAASSSESEETGS